MKPIGTNKSDQGNLLKNLEGEPLVRIAILFGSFGTAREMPESDVDIAIAGPAPLDTDQKLKLLALVEKSTGRAVDLIDLQTATGTVFKEALSRGRILINHDTDLMGRLLIRMLSDEADYQIRKRTLAAEARERILDISLQGVAHENYIYSEISPGHTIVKNDIGLINLDRDAAEWTQPSAIAQHSEKEPVIIVKNGNFMSRGFLGILAGYGRTSSNSGPATTLRLANSELVSTSFNDMRLNFLLPTSGVCDGDSGGPTYNWNGNSIAIVGINSQGSCELFNSSDEVLATSPNGHYETYMATNVSKYVSWIKSHASGGNIKTDSSKPRVSDIPLDVEEVIAKIDFFK